MSCLLDADTLLQAIAENEPVGLDPRTSDPKNCYQQLKDARTCARRLEREALLSTEANPEIKQQWQRVAKLSVELLKQQAKDIEAAVWLIEALTRLHGFAGLADGFTLLTQLIENYWPAIYPIEDEEGLPGKLSALTGLNGVTSPGALIDPIYWIALVDAPADFNTWHYQQTLQTTDLPNEPAENGLNLAMLEEAAKQSGPVFMQQLKTDIERCLTTYQALCQLLDGLCGVENAPPSSNIRNALQACLNAITQISKNLLPAITATASTDQTDTKNQAVAFEQNTINSRQQAFASLVKLADYFRQHEPNSPVSYLIEQAVRWGNMPLPQLLAEIISDHQVLTHSYQLIGVKNQDDSYSS